MYRSLALAIASLRTTKVSRPWRDRLFEIDGGRWQTYEQVASQRCAVEPVHLWCIGRSWRLSASEFLDRIAALMPPPHKHQHRYFGVLAPNSPWRALVTAQAGR